MPSFTVRYQVVNGRGEHVCGPVEEVITAPSQADARAVVRARYPNCNVTILSVLQVR